LIALGDYVFLANVYNFELNVTEERNRVFVASFKLEFRQSGFGHRFVVSTTLLC